MCGYSNSLRHLRTDLALSLLQRAPRVLPMCLRLHNGEPESVLKPRHPGYGKSQEKARLRPQPLQVVDLVDQETGSNVLAPSRAEPGGQEQYSYLQGALRREDRKWRRCPWPC